MAIERELKAVVSDPAALRVALRAAGATELFRGMLRDRRYDRHGELDRLDQVLRVRRWIPVDGAERAEIGWKGPASVGTDGYKHAEEIEVVAGDGAVAQRLLEALGYQVIHAIDRYVEVLRLDEAVARLEWYPRMDVLIEIEGTPAAIERLVAASGLPRDDCLPDRLTQFVARYQARTGRSAALAEAALAGEAPTWSAA